MNPVDKLEHNEVNVVILEDIETKVSLYGDHKEQEIGGPICIGAGIGLAIGLGHRLW